MRIQNKGPNSRKDLSGSQVINKGIVLFTISLTLFFTSYMFSSVNIALPAISSDFNAHVIELNWVTTAIIVSSSIFLIPFGRLSDIVGIKKMFTLGIVLYIVANAISALSVSIIMLIIMRLVQGISAAMITGNAIAMVSVLFPPGERGRALGVTSSAVYIGLAFSPLISGFLTAQFGWRSIFLISVPAGLISLFLIFWKIKGEWRESKGERMDLIGTAIFGFSIVALMYGFSILPGIEGILLISAGIIVLVGFILWESRIKSPLIKLDLFKKNKVFVFSNISALINYAATFAIVFFLSLYLQYIKGMGAETTGLMMAAQPFIMAVLSPVMGKLSDRIEPRVLASLGMAITCLSLAFFIFLSDDTPIILILIALVILGTGFSLFVPPNTNAIMSSVELKYYGVSSAVMNTMRNFGQMLSMGVAMIVLALVMGSVIITPENYFEFITSTRISFAVFAVLCFIGIFTSLSRGNVRKIK
jgi:MFS family permease